MVLMIPKMYHIWGYNVKICINAPKILQTLFLDILELPDHPEGDQKLWKLLLNNLCGPKATVNKIVVMHAGGRLLNFENPFSDYKVIANYI